MASLELIAELATRDVAAELGYSGLADVLRDVVRISLAEARRRICHAEAVAEVPLVSGGVVPAALPVAAAALRDGVLGADHLEVIAKVARELPPHVPEAARDTAEQTLVDAAHRFDARTLARIGDRVRAVFDQDGSPPDGRELATSIPLGAVRRSWTVSVHWTRSRRGASHATLASFRSCSAAAPNRWIVAGPAIRCPPHCAGP